jgi:hypothetical protein
MFSREIKQIYWLINSINNSCAIGSVGVEGKLLVVALDAAALLLQVC